MGAYFKTIMRSFKSNLGRFISISVIIMLGVAFVAGLGALSPVIRGSFSDYLVKNKAADMIVKSTAETGFLPNELDDIMAEFEGDADISAAVSFTAVDGNDDNGGVVKGYNARVYVLDVENLPLNQITLREGGRYPENANEVLIDRASRADVQVKIGDTLNIFGMDREVVGVVTNPLLFAKDGEPDIINEETLEVIAYLNPDFTGLPFPLPTTDIMVGIEGAAENGYFSSSYKHRTAEIAEKFETAHENTACLTMEQNRSYMLLDSYCDKVNILSLIFPAFFIAVVALVVLTTVSRLIEEERASLACYKTLGYSNGKIIFKYLFLSMTCCIVASAVGMGVGVAILPRVIYPAFTVLFILPKMTGAVSMLAGLIALIGMLITVFAVTMHVARSALKGPPATILRPKTPKAGKKVLLERIPFIWKRLSFKYKSTFRNILRNVKHLLMTVISVAGSTALAFAGFALLNVAQSPVGGMSGNFGDLFKPIAAVIIIFALLLCAFVVYNLTNMNIGERKREIATLKVLGYTETETAGYIYREVFIMSLLGVLVGIPLGVGLMAFLFKFLDFGSLAAIEWHAYVAAGLIVLLFVVIVDLLLAPKIRAIDMASSLKSVE